MKYIRLLAFILLAFIQFNLGAQNNKFAMWFGARSFNQPPLSQTSNLDFYDYYISLNWDHTNYKAIYSYLGFSYFRKWNDILETDLRITTNSGFKPNTIYAKGIYYKNKNIGLSATYYQYPQLLDDYQDYFTTNMPNMYSNIIEAKTHQWSIKDHTISAGLVVPIRLHDAQIKFGFNTGVVFNSNYKGDIIMKDKTSNLKQLQKYSFLPSPAPFIHPEVEINIDFIDFNGKAFGIQFQSSWFYTVRAINYKLDTYTWTMDNHTQETIKGVKHKFTKFELDGGFHYKW